MKGNQRVIDGLNSLLALELTAMDQYFIHSRLYDDWGLTKLFETIGRASGGDRVRWGGGISRVGRSEFKV